MNVRVVMDDQNPQTVDVVLPDWSLGGPKQRFTLSLYEALLLRAELNRVLP